MTYTRTKKGKNNGTSIAYVIREHNIPTPDMTFPTEIDEKIGRALLIGPLYNANDADMYDLLKSLSGNGPLGHLSNRMNDVAMAEALGKPSYNTLKAIL